MYPHHTDSIKILTDYCRNKPEIIGLLLVGSVATGEARADSDLDCVAIISQEALDERIRTGVGSLEVVHGMCTYNGGYFDIHYHSPEQCQTFATSGSEPMRNLFRDAQVLYCDDPQLVDLVAAIPRYPKKDAALRQFKFYCTFKMFHRYFWNTCKPEGFFRTHVANGMVFNLYRLILIENEILFPCMRKLESTVTIAPNKPAHIIEKTARLLQTLDDKDCAALVEAYENWTSYDYPKDHNTIMNNFANKWEWE
ncbi:MAG: nucleotidyltransferase domain-containing protein [Defluviitaleaceae bacterium]|nr:nucleotidyltransferase domain-containing protein [Defluviitaleaceae bacterium]